MAQNIYIAGAEAKNGKSVIALGLMELLSARTNHLGFFRPVIRSKDTPVYQLARIFATDRNKLSPN